MIVARYAAFLRGVNVGGRIVKMADLRACLEKAGLENVTTLLQSGNVIFESAVALPELKRLIEVILTETFNYPAKVQVMSIETLRSIVDNYPFGEAGDNQHDYVIFLEDNLEDELLNEPYDLTPGEQVKAGKGVVYWRVDRGLTLKSNFAKQFAKAKYKNFNTNRNLKTLRKILAI